MYKLNNFKTIGFIVALTITSNAYAESDLDSLQKKSEDLVNEIVAEKQKAISRLSHAKELLGRRYKKSIVKSGENIAVLDDVLVEWTEKALPKAYKSQAREVVQTIVDESEQYGFDPIFLMAVIENESSFNPKAVGTSGDIGLMQITNDTAKWISAKFNIAFNKTQSLKDPITNIKIGAAYMAYLRDKFGPKGKLYIAAYNMGSGNIKKLLSRHRTPKVYSGRVMQRYVKFYTQLQQQITSAID